ncbi:MAG: SIMPL domain-containing protein [Chloroflexota bacterium]
MKRTLMIMGALLLAVGLLAGGCEYTRGSFVPEQNSKEASGTTIVSQQESGIWVNGRGEVEAPPDMANLRLGIEARADTVDEAQSQAQQAMDDVMQALDEQGIAEKDIQTRRFSIRPITRRLEREQQEEIQGYRVSNMVEVTIRDVDAVGDVVDVVTQAGGDLTRIEGINFTIDDPTEYYEQAREQAVGDAEEKAEQLADGAGVELGAPTYISEGSTDRPETPDVAMPREEAEAAGETPISPGELTVTVNVQVVYSIEE